MAQRSGSADLPLHGGQVPKWLADRMTRLGAVMTEAVVHHYGRDELLRRLANPYWFQSFGAVMGMDWHSSGITTSVIGALKRGLTPLQNELGIHVCGGRGKYSRQTPGELIAIGDHVGFDGGKLAQASRLVAKVDSAAVQDGFDLYLHGFVVTDDGHWAVVQQGMNGERRQARRYHWLSEGLTSFVDDPHAAIDGVGQGEIVNLADRRAARSRGAQLDLLSSLGPDRIVSELARLEGPARQAEVQPLLPHLVMPAHHDVRPEDVVAHRLHGNLAAAADRGPADFSELLLTPGVGARTVRAWRWWPKSCTAPRAGSAIPGGSRLRTAARTGTRSRCRSRFSMRPSRCGSRPFRRRSWAAMRSLAHCGGSTTRPVSSSATRPVPRSTT